MNLYPHQVKGVDFLIHTPKAILGDSMGLGKTIQAIELVNRVGGETLIVCPAFLRANWHDEIRKFAKKPELFEVVSYSQLKHIKNLKAKNIIADEAHYLKNPDAKRSDLFYQITNKYKPERLVLMTGTPVKNRVSEWWSLLYLVGATKRGYYPFCHRYSNVKTYKFGGRNITKFEGHKNVDELKRILAPYYLRRRASQVLDLPPIIRKEVLINEDYIDHELLQAWNEGKTLSTVKANSAKIKVPHTVKYAANILEAGEGPVVIFCDHVEPIQSISGELHRKKFRSKVITGSTSMDERAAIVRDFQDGNLDAICATIGALSVGVTLTAARNMIFNSVPWVPADLLQAEKRIHRIGQDESCVIHRMAYGKVDSMIYRTLNKKLKTLKEVL